MHLEQRVPLPITEDPISHSFHSEEICDAVLAQRPAFLVRRRADIVKMRNALAVEDFALIQSIGHNCKGIGSGYGFSEISRLGSAIENAARALDVSRLIDCVARFEHYVCTFLSGEADEA